MDVTHRRDSCMKTSLHEHGDTSALASTLSSRLQAFVSLLLVRLDQARRNPLRDNRAEGSLLYGQPEVLGRDNPCAHDMV